MKTLFAFFLSLSLLFLLREGEGRRERRRERKGGREGENEKEQRKHKRKIGR